MVIWNEKFATGSSIIDAHHQLLINHINELEMLLSRTNLDRAECESIVSLVEFLESYAGTHFKFEEQCMERYRCPAHARNQQEHQQFLEFFRDFKARYQAEGFRPDLLESLHRMTSAWIQKHILQVDTQLRSCFKGR